MYYNKVPIYPIFYLLKGDYIPEEASGWVGGEFYCRPLINKPPTLNRDYDRDPNIEARKRKGAINQGSPLGLSCMPMACQVFK